MPKLFWSCAVLAVVLWSLVPGYVVGWDYAVYGKAIQSLRLGHDPYTDGIAVQTAYHLEAVHAPGEPVPYTYVYGPVTLLLLRLLTQAHATVVAFWFWAAYGAGALTAIWAGLQAVETERERWVMALLAPAVIFFPGLLQNDTLFSGNIAFILYGLAWYTALRGWQGRGWGGLYAVILLGCLWKPPLLTLLAIPVMSARGQWLRAGCTALLGTIVFALQKAIWPTLFVHYLQAVDLQFRWNHDFGSNPAGVVANALSSVLPYRVVSAMGYLLVTCVVLTILTRHRKQFFDERISLRQWMPVLLIGTVLLSPRIMEYDLAAITVPMALVVWRFAASHTGTVQRAVLAAGAFLLLINAFAPLAWADFAPSVAPVVRSVVLVVVFAAGSWQLSTVAAAPGLSAEKR